MRALVWGYGNMLKETVIVGVHPAVNQVICMPEDVAYEHARLQHALHTANTWGEFRRLAPPDSLAEAEERAASLAEDLELPAPRDDTPFDPYEQVHGYADADWPDYPMREMISWLPESVQRLGAIGSTALNGQILEIDGLRVQEVITALVAEGYRVLRSDAAVNSY